MTTRPGRLNPWFAAMILLDVALMVILAMLARIVIFSLMGW